MSKVFVRDPFNYDVDAVSVETGLKCEDESLAQQHQKEEADINTIVRRFGLTGELPQNVRQPQYGDFTGIKDYQSALHVVMAAEESFMAMPADVRDRFKNDPEVFVNWCCDPKNLEEARKLGLAVQNEPAAEPPAPPVAQSPVPAAAGESVAK